MSASLTVASLDLFLALAEDADNWSGTPMLDGNVSTDNASKGNVTDLKRKGLIKTMTDAGDTFVYFTDKGKALAAEHGIDLSWA